MTSLLATLVVSLPLIAAPPVDDPIAEPDAPTGAAGGFDTNPATGAPVEEAPQFAPVSPSGASARPEAGGGVETTDRAERGTPSNGAPPASAAMGQGTMAPLPPPPPPVDPRWIKKGPWRGRGYLRLQVDLAGPVGGAQPARANVVSWGGAAEIGWRINNWVEVGFGVEGRPHRRIERTLVVDGTTFTEVTDAAISNWDLAVARFFYPLDGRIQPFAEVGGGVAILGSLPGEDSRVGGQGRAGLGTDFWVSRNLSLELAIGYRLAALDATVGHHLAGRLGLGIHW